MALAEQAISANYPDGSILMNHYTYCLCGDGCLQEGISQEAISLAGHLKLSKLILIYDCNDVTLDGPLGLSFSENTKQRFLAANWNVIEVEDGNDINAIDNAFRQAKRSSDKPTLIKVHTIIGFGSKNQGTSKVHGSPLGVEDGNYTKKEVYGFDHEDFFVPEEVYTHFRSAFINRGYEAEILYNKHFEEYKSKHKMDALRFETLQSNDVDKFLPHQLPEFVNGSSTSTRVASGKALNDYMLSVPNLFGGSADVAGSVMTKLNGIPTFTSEDRSGHNINFGIREFAMASLQNGMLLHGGIRTYVGCFFVFCDYLKPAIRMAALSHIPAIYLFSHDSIALGEDGPTHQPIEQLAMLRSIPNLHVIRPCDERETYAAWELALRSQKTPTALILSRQNLPLLENSSKAGVDNGGYVISKEKEQAEFTLIATGSEVSLAIEAQKKLLNEGIDIRVVSLPCWDIFSKKDEAYQNEVMLLPKNKRISIELLSTFGWDKFADHHIGLDEFGDSGKASDLMKKYHFTVDDVVSQIKSLR